MKKLITLFALALIATWCNAQSPLVTDANASMQADTLGNYACTYIVVLSDTSAITNIEIMLGTASGSNDLLLQDVVYDNAGSLPQGWTYNRTGNIVTIAAGAYAESNIYFGQVRLKANGSWSNPYQFIAN